MELTKLEYAAIKRTASTVKVLKSKKESIQAKVNLLLADIERIDKNIEMWEKPVMEMTGGFTSDQILDGTWRLSPKEEEVNYNIEEEINNN